MPVFSRFRDDVLVLTVDGDYTANEVRRVAFGAFEAEETPRSVPVLLDMSGAAGLKGLSAEELESSGAIFGAYRDRISGIAIVVSSEYHPLFAEGSGFAEEAGIVTRACRSHQDARDWLKDR